MGCCSTKEKMPGPKEERPQEDSKKALVATVLLIVLLAGILLYML